MKLLFAHSHLKKKKKKYFESCLDFAFLSPNNKMGICHRVTTEILQHIIIIIIIILSQKNKFTSFGHVFLTEIISMKRQFNSLIASLSLRCGDSDLIPSCFSHLPPSAHCCQAEKTKFPELIHVETAGYKMATTLTNGP